MIIGPVTTTIRRHRADARSIYKHFNRTIRFSRARKRQRIVTRHTIRYARVSRDRHHTRRARRRRINRMTGKSAANDCISGTIG